MKPNWEAELRQLERVQEDLRRRLDALDERLAALRREEPGDVPSPVRPPPLPQVEPPVQTPPIVWSAPAVPEPARPPQSAPPPAQKPDGASLELKVGQYWLVRIGVVVLLTGLVLLGNLAYQNIVTKLGAGGKLSLLLLVGGALTATGWMLERRGTALRNYGRVLLAGGAAVIYYTAYAAHFVATLRVIENPFLAGVVLLALAGGLAAFAVRRRLEGVAFLAILLSFYTGAINPADGFTLFSNLVLAVTAVVLLARERWFGVSWLSLFGAYGSFLFWSLRYGETGFWPAQGFVVGYWVVFTAAVFLRGAAVFPRGHREVFLTVNNAAFFALMVPAIFRDDPAHVATFALCWSGVLFLLALAARRLRGAEPGFDGAYVTHALIVLAVGMVAKWSGTHLAVLLAVESLALIFCSRFRHGALLQAAGALTSGSAAVLSLGELWWGRPEAWLPAAWVAVCLVGNAAQLRLRRPDVRWHWRTAGFLLMGFALGAAVVADRCAGTVLVGTLAGLAVATCWTLRWHRLPEGAVLGQGFLGLALILAVGQEVWDGPAQASLAIAAAGALAIMHFWQRNSDRAGGRIWEAIEAGGVVVAGFFLIRPDAAGCGAFLPVAAVGLAGLAYGVTTRARFLALFSQGFSALAVFWLAGALWQSSGSAGEILAALALLALQAAAVRWQAGRQSEFREVAIGYAAVVVALLAGWIWRVTPDTQRFLLFTGLAVGPVAVGLRKHHAETVWHGVALTAVGLAAYGWTIGQGALGTGADLLALCVLLGLQQFGRRHLRPAEFPPAVQAALATLNLGAIWWQVSRWAWTDAWEPAVTVVWAALAFLVLGAGFLLRDRTYRLTGLGILAIAVGRVFFIDVWRMGQVAGVLGIIGLAVILLALGFIYNRFADQIRRWL